MYSGLTNNERKTFILHIVYSIIDGLILGVFSLNEFVYKKNFDPGNLKLSMLFQLSVIVLPFSIFFTNFFEKVKNKKKLLYQIGISTRAPLLLFLFFPFLFNSGVNIGFLQDVFLLIFLLFYFATPFTLPLINQLLKANYGIEKLGKLYSYSWTINMFTQLVTILVFGMLLDVFPNAYIYIYPVLGILAMISIWLISKIKSDKVEREYEKISLLKSWKSTFDETYEILKENKPFRDFQIGLMIYGLAFLMNLSIVTLFLNDVLNLTYSEVAGYKSISLTLSIVTLPLFGVLLDRLDPRRFANISYALAASYFLFLIFNLIFPFNFTFSGIHIFAFTTIAYIVYGFFQSSMTILWGIGSSYFTTSEKAGIYQSIHCTLTGIRGLAAPFVGTAIYTFGTYFNTKTGYIVSFGTSIFLLILAMIYMKKSLKKNPQRIIQT
ncbi:MAG: MFS transporter [Bacteroidota bacterium]